MERRRRDSRSEKTAAIHRALLAGLLGNIGHRTDEYEYTGPRGVKFAVHPGSALFREPPQWVMAAELVETTRLYARTCAAIDPEWIERLADHLLKRTWSDPRWDEQLCHVVATERATLWGLPVVPQRSVHYGPINPRESREILIRALVSGEYRPDAPFYRHNQRLIEEIERLEAKSRQRDILVSEAVRFDFYDARIPADVYSGPLFERWRKQVERTNPRALFMSRRDLMQHAGSDVTREMFPDCLTVGTLTIPLEYHFEPGHPADGVTATIPLAALNQIPAERFEWLVPGILREKITALIKSLPKNLRVNFVPAPEYAEAAASELKPGDGSLLEALALFLSRRTGVTVPPEAFDPQSLLDHLHMNFRVVDEKGRTLVAGRNLDELRRRLGMKVKAVFSQAPHPVYHRDNITRWDFGDLPESVPVTRHGLTLAGYPALVDTGSSVSLRVLDSPRAAQESHAAGLRRLLLTELRDEIAYVQSMLPNMQQLALYYATLGPSEDLRADIVNKAINRAFLYDSNVRTAMEFELRKEAGRRHRLLQVAREVAELAGRILAAWHAAAVLLERPVIPAWEPAICDVRQQISHLMRKGFLADTPDQWLAHYPRYLKAVELRLAKLSTVGHTRDAARMAEVKPFWDAYLVQCRRHAEQNLRDPELELFRWMVEEYRVSLFAQELRTSMPISAKRLQRQWERVRK